MKRFLKIVVIVFLSASAIAIFQSCKKTVPDVTTADVSGITTVNAVSGGNVTDNGGAWVTARGVCWATTQNPTIGSSKTSDGAGNGVFTSTMTPLTRNTLYYVKAYATNSEGTGYGSELSFTTGTIPPAATVTAATSLTNTTATLNGTVNANGISTTVTFEFGISNLYGHEAPGTPSPITGTSPTNISAGLGNLTPGITYHFRIKAVSGDGTTYSNDLTFLTLQEPVAKTAAATSLTNTTATLNGTVNATNLSTTVTFEYGTSVSYGSIVTATPNPVTGGNLTSVSAGIAGLKSGQNYHYRVKAVSSGGTCIGGDITFTASVKDYDDNVYNIVTIGTQVWMKENLKTTKYSDGGTIPLVTDNTAWSNLTSPGYCWYNNTSTYKDIYGALYNWYTVNTGKLCPVGWHVPSDAEWTTLTTYLGGGSEAGGKLKETGTTHWSSPNTGATNESGFTALPGGGRGRDGIFGNWATSGEANMLYYGWWWSTTQYAGYETGAWPLGMSAGSKSVIRIWVWMKDGFSVRCLRN
jgi:uncharacterized protein (TIGR02145 family)